MKLISLVSVAALATTILVTSGCVVYPGRATIVENNGGPFTCNAYGVGGRHWVITAPYRAGARNRVLNACVNGGGVGCYIPPGGCTPW